MIQHRNEWIRYKKAFEQLGQEGRGMSPAAAAHLAETAKNCRQDNSKGWSSLVAAAPVYVTFDGHGIPKIFIPNDYLACQEFWKIDPNYNRAKITETGMKYVLEHGDIFALLAGAQK